MMYSKWTSPRGSNSRKNEDLAIGGIRHLFQQLTKIPITSFCYCSHLYTVCYVVAQNLDDGLHITRNLAAEHEQVDAVNIRLLEDDLQHGQYCDTDDSACAATAATVVTKIQFKCVCY